MSEFPTRTNDDFADPTAITSKLSPENQAFIQSDEFVKFFAGSVMVDDETGEPQLWYHGTNRQFDTFDQANEARFISNFGLEHDGLGVYLTADKYAAAQFADPLGATLLDDLESGNHEAFSHRVRYYDQLVSLFVEHTDRFSLSKEKSGSPRYELDKFGEAISNGDIGYWSYLMFQSDKSEQVVGLVEKFVHVFGGALPTSADELAPYESQFPGVQHALEKLKLEQGQELLMPARVKPRIIPAFVGASDVTIVSVSGLALFDIDNGFAGASGQAALERGAHAVKVVPESDKLMKECLLVPDPNRLMIAPSL